MMKKIMLTIFIVLVISSFLLATPKPDDIVIIANKSVTKPELSMKQLEQIFLSKLTAWPDKSGAVKPYNLKMESPQRTAFQKVVLGKTADEMKKYWVKKRIEGKEKPPQAKNSTLMVTMMVSKLKGAIGYCFYKDIKPAILSKIQLIKIDGKESLAVK